MSRHAAIVLFFTLLRICVRQKDALENNISERTEHAAIRELYRVALSGKR
jgi:hypothetical protein